VRAGKIASLVLVLIVTAVATGVRAFSFWVFELDQASPLTRGLVFASVVAAVSLLVLLPIGATLDRALSQLRHSIENMSHSPASPGAPRQGGPAAGIIAQSKWMKPLTRALVGAVDRFRQREQSLRAQLNDLEIRHRVSEAQRRQIEAVLHSLRDGVIVTDAFGELVMANQAAADILGFDRDKAIHKPIDEVIGSDRLRRLVHEVRDAADFSNARHVELTIADAATDVLPSAEQSHGCTYDVILTCVENHKHEVAGVVTLLHDLTREREISQMKSDFVSKASHELRTPLSSIRAYVEMLVDGEAADEKSRQEFYRIIQGETDRLGRLIDNMLNISRIEAGIVQIEREYVDVKALINRAMNTLEPQATEKKLSLHSRVSDVDLCVEGDADMLYQVVLNLLSNAVKYTPDGGRITVAADSMGEIRGQRPVVSGQRSVVRHSGGDQASATCAGTDSPAHHLGSPSRSETRHGAPLTVSPSHRLLVSGPSVVVSVSDTGLGIPPDALPKLFDKFYRVENYKRVAKGTGLGLSLCKHIVETVHGGQIGVESKLGMGSKFWFSVPVKYAGGASPQAARGAGVGGKMVA
jgi:two-component system phosphate regulon sensor histidine kinase PhoR